MRSRSNSAWASSAMANSSRKTPPIRSLPRNRLATAREVVAQGQVLPHDRQALVAGGDRIAGERLPAISTRTGVGHRGLRDALDERRLAGPVLADQREDLTAVQLEIDALQHLDRAEPLVHVAHAEHGAFLTIGGVADRLPAPLLAVSHGTSLPHPHRRGSWRRPSASPCRPMAAGGCHTSGGREPPTYRPREGSMRAQPVRNLAAATAAALLVLAAGCSSGSDELVGRDLDVDVDADLGQPDHELGRPTSTTAASTTTGTPTSTSTPSSTRCHTSQLDAAVGAEPRARRAASTSRSRWTNRSSTTCVIEGYPGVSLLDGPGHQIGVPATQGAGSGHGRHPPSGGAGDHHGAHAQRRCRVGWVLGHLALRQDLPARRAGLPDQGRRHHVCGNTFTVTPVTAGGSV